MSSKRYNFYLPVDLKEDLDKIAESNRRPTSEQLRIVLEKYVAAHKANKQADSK